MKTQKKEQQGEQQKTRKCNKTIKIKGERVREGDIGIDGGNKSKSKKWKREERKREEAKETDV